MESLQVRGLPLRSASPSTREASENEAVAATSEAINNEPKKTGKSRVSKPKVRTGCLTCKIRRIKCDETKPICSRCTSTGRKCDGYTIPPPRKTRSDFGAASSKVSPERCLDIIRGSQQELQALDLFQTRTAPGLSTYFDADFWTRLIFQVSHTEPAIRHAMLAVASLHQLRENGTTIPRTSRPAAIDHPLETCLPLKTNAVDHDDPFALAHYNRAIQHLSIHLKKPNASPEIALLACILFICVELLRGDEDAMVNHFKSGMSIVISPPSNSGSGGGSLSMKRIRESMLPFFNRMEVLAALFGNDLQWVYPVDLSDTVPAAFTSVQQARDSIVHLANLGLRYIRSMRFKPLEPHMLPEDVARRDALKRQLEMWRLRFDDLLLLNIDSPKELDAARMIRIHQIVILVWVQSCTVPTQSFFDAFMPEFETAMKLAETLQTQSGNREGRAQYSTFSFDTEVVSPLYFIVTKCRHPQIRRRILAVLRRLGRREGLWDSGMTAAVGERVMMIEEANLTMFDGSELPPETDRVHNVDFNSPPGMKPADHVMTFYTKPDGVDGEWKIWQETLFL